MFNLFFNSVKENVGYTKGVIWICRSKKDRQ